MTDKKPCGKCKECKCKPCDTLPTDADLYVEVDDTGFRPYRYDGK